MSFRSSRVLFANDVPSSVDSRTSTLLNSNDEHVASYRSSFSSALHNDGRFVSPRNSISSTPHHVSDGTTAGRRNSRSPNVNANGEHAAGRRNSRSLATSNTADERTSSPGKDTKRSTAGSKGRSRAKTITEMLPKFRRSRKSDASSENAMFFSDEENTDQGAGINIRGTKEPPAPRSRIAAIVPDNSPSFRFRATFKNHPAGHYVLRWRVKLLDNFSIPTALRFSVRIIYDDEPDTTGSLNVIVPPEELLNLERGPLYDLRLEELVVIQPYMRHYHYTPQLVRVVVAMSNCESDDITNVTYSGLQVHFVELVGLEEDQALEDVHEEAPRHQGQPESSSSAQLPRISEELKLNVYPVKGAARPRFTIDAMKSPVFGSDPKQPSIPISRLAWSKDSNLMAVLALGKNAAYVTVWDMEHIGDPTNPPANMDILHQHCYVAIVKYKGVGELQGLPIGLAISSKGDQVALYQEPKIGQWANGTKLDQSSFKFTLLTIKPEQLSLAIDTNDNGGSDAKTTPENNHPNQLHQLGRSPNHMLENFIGYGTFLGKRWNTNWDMSEANIERPPGDSQDGKDTKNTIASTFVACNGIYIQVFKIEQEYNWENTHSIKLTDLTPTLSRRITCKMMMDAISNNTFMWLEDNGLCCTVWHLWKGSIFSYITRTGNAKFVGHNFRNNSKMAISPDESVVALAHDGILATYHTHTGILVHERNFSGSWIEYVAFHGQDNQLFVVTRSTTSFRLNSWVLDPLRLDSGMPANQVPIPSIGKTTLSFFRGDNFKGKGLICDADGAKIHCYLSYTPADNEVTEKGLKSDDLIFKDVVQHEDMQYEVRTKVHAAPLQDSEDSTYWIMHVEVTKNGKPSFSFVPEPWMRVLTDAVRDPAYLQSVYFLPGGRRFVVIGMQSIQVWSLPTRNNREFDLVYFWSRPRTEDDEKWSLREGYRTETVGMYYHCVQRPCMYLDADTWAVKIKVEMQEGPWKMDNINIPGERSVDIRSTFLYCSRSIHLLASAYAYSCRKHDEVQRNYHESTITFGKHAEAILRFTRDHINRLLPREDFYPDQPSRTADIHDGTRWIGQPVTREVDRALTASFQQRSLGPDRDSSNASLMESSNCERGVLSIDERTTTMQSMASQNVGGPQRQDVTIITLLLDQHELNDANQDLIHALLRSVDHEWVPHAHISLNPVRRMIRFRDEQLLKTVIDYCLSNAKNRHAAYLTPIVQCLDELSNWYPDILSDIFRKAAYMPASNPEYVTSHAIIVNPRFTDTITFIIRFCTFFLYRKRWFAWTKSADISDYMRPIFTLRSQLPVTKRCRETQFPETQEKVIEDQPHENRSRKICVSPFQFQPVVQSHHHSQDDPLDDRQRKGSVFARIAGGEFFDSLAISVILRFKWYKFGLYYWLIRFIIVLVFFILVLITTAQQIQSSLASNGQDPTTDGLDSRYLPDVRPAILTIVTGTLLIMYEILQISYSPSEYIRSPYNYVDLAAYICPIVGCFFFLLTTPNQDYDDNGIDKKIWVMGFGIMFLYLNVLFEMRVIRQLGIAVNIIFHITRRISWFFLIFGLFLLGFTHTLLYVLHTRRLNACQSGPCDKDGESSYPTGFFEALSATYFFLSGRYDPVNSSFGSNSVGFHIMMIIFYFFTVLLLLNILIALMNDAFNQSAKEGKIGHRRLLSKVIAEVEEHALTKHVRRTRTDYFPKYIYYCASEGDVEKFELQYSVAENSGLSPENRFIVEQTQRAAHTTESSMEHVKHGLSVLKDQTSKDQGQLKRELAEIRRLVECRRDQDGLRKEVSNSKIPDQISHEQEESRTPGGSKEHPGRPNDYDELKGELAEITRLVTSLALKMEAMGKTS